MPGIRTHVGTACLALALLASCAGKPPTATSPRRPAATAASVAPPLPAGATLIGDQGSALQPTGDAPFPAAAAGLVGKVKGPAGIISNNGGTIISDNGGGLTSKVKLRLQALEEVPLAGVKVALETAAGEPVRDAAGNPYETVTGADGSYKLDFKGNANNLVVRAALGGDKGSLLAFTPKSSAGTVNVDTASSLALGYVLDQYVKGQQAILEKLPADVEAETRGKVAAALAADATAVPDAFTPAKVVASVQQLRAANSDVDGQLEKVRRILLAGLSDQGIGQPVTDVEINPVAVALDPLTGELVFAEANSQRIYKKDVNGKLAVVAGNGDLGSVGRQGRDGAPENVPAESSSLFPMAMVYGQDGTLYIGDLTAGAIRKVGRDGKIATLAKFPGLTAIRDMDRAPDGSLRVATDTAIYGLTLEGTLKLLSGRFTPYDPLAFPPRPVVTSPKPPADARYTDIQGITVDPATGDVLVFDAPGIIRRVAKDAVTTIAGRLMAESDPENAAVGDGGPAKDALFAATGDLVVAPDGSLIVSDGAHNRLRRIKDGQVETYAGDGTLGLRGDGGPLAGAQIAMTTKLSYAPDGALLICGDGMIRRIHEGRISTPVGATKPNLGKRPANDVQLAIPGQILYEPEHNALLIQEVRHVLRWTLDDNMIETLAAKGPAGAPFTQGMPALEPYMTNISGLWKLADGTIGFVATTADTRVGAFNLKDGVLTRIAGGRRYASPEEPGTPIADLYVPPDAQTARIGDTVYIGGKKDGVIYALRPDGTAKVIAGLGGEEEPVVAPDGSVNALEIFFEGIAALGAGPDGALYVGQMGYIDRIDPRTGRCFPVAGNGAPDAPRAGVKALDSPVGLVSGFTWDAEGQLYFSIGSHGLVMRLDQASGKLVQVAGQGSPNLAGPRIDDALSFPMGLTFDRQGNLFIVDDIFHQVKMIPADRLP